jgi:long-chain fatty acid transport protein
MRKLALPLAAACWVAASPAYATNGMRMIGFGPVQTSMGGVGVGATLDSAALVSNPAGIVDQDRRLDVGLGLFVPRPSYAATGTPVPPGFPPFIAQDGRRVRTDRGPSPIPFVGVVLPVREDLKAGLALSAVAGMGVDYASNLYSSDALTSYLQARLTPGIAYRFGDMFSAGVGANFMLAQMEWDVASAFGQQRHDTATSLGIGGVVGVKLTPVAQVSFGAAYETQSYFADFGFDVPAHPNPFDPLQTIPAFEEKLTFHQPAVATVGVAVRPLAGADPGPLVIAADVEWINWSATNGLAKPAFTTESLDPASGGAFTRAGSMTWNLRWSDQWVFKIGAQLEPARRVKVRAGYNYGKNPLRAGRAFENVAFPAVQEHHITAGAGIDATDRVAINVAGMYAPPASISGSNPNFPAGTPGYPGPFGQGIQSYSSRMYQWQIDAGLAWRF